MHRKNNNKPKLSPTTIMEEKKTDLNIGILYISLYKQLKNNVGVDNIISRKEFFTILGKHFLIPKNIRDVVIKEMEKRELVERVSRDSIRVLDCDYDLDKDAHKFYEMIGFF